MRALWTAAVLAAFCFVWNPQARAFAAREPAVTADAAVVIDLASGTVLYGKRVHHLMHPASVTKMMTAVIALERGYVGDVVTVSQYAAYTPGSCMGLAPGSRFLLEDLLSGLMLVSGNDAAVAIAEHIAGTEPAFVQLMNARAREIGASSTTFTNPHGLSEPGHMSTAYDLALIARHGLSIPYFAGLVATREREAWRLDRLSEVPLYSTNRLLGSYLGADGVKTGTTDAAGACLCASATRGGMTFISVVLHSDARWDDSARLLEWAFENFEQVVSLRRGDAAGRIAVSGGTRSSARVEAAADLSGVIRKGEDSTLWLRLDMKDGVTAPVFRGDRVGSVALWTSDRLVSAVPLVASETVERWTPLRFAAGLFIAVIRALGLLGVG
ncbi:MAG: D-alanyl-D-alanine carboxypeptidase [Firmicutes bacterium]|nr:D-alanyl-D-alanine carboxypeptidase [Bacillota bacterium]